MQFTNDVAGKLERIEFGSPAPIGFDMDGSGFQLRRLLSVGLHGRRQRLGLIGDRYRVVVPVTCNGLRTDLVLDNEFEVNAVMRHMAHMPITPRRRLVSRRRAGELVGQAWIGGL